MQLAVHTGIPFGVWAEEDLRTIQTAQRILADRGEGTGKPQSDSRVMEG